MEFDKLTELEKLFDRVEIVALLFVEFFRLDKLSRLVDCTLPVLLLTFLDLTVNYFPVFGCTVLSEAPFLELALVLAFAVGESGVCLGVNNTERPILTF